MPFSLLPKAIFCKLTDISPEYLKKNDLSLLMLDFDNTMLPYTAAEPTEELLAWIKVMKDNGIRLCVVSNSKKDKALNFCRQNGVDCITRAKKPFQRGIAKCLKQYDIHADNAAMVGDQIYTDVLGGNCAGAFSILVKPLHLHNIWLKLRHLAEQPFILSARKRRITQ